MTHRADRTTHSKKSNFAKKLLMIATKMDSNCKLHEFTVLRKDKSKPYLPKKQESCYLVRTPQGYIAFTKTIYKNRQSASIFRSTHEIKIVDGEETIVEEHRYALKLFHPLKKVLPQKSKTESALSDSGQEPDREPESAPSDSGQEPDREPESAPSDSGQEPDREKAIRNEEALLKLYGNSRVELIQESETFAILYEYTEGETLEHFLTSDFYREEMTFFDRLKLAYELIKTYKDKIFDKGFSHCDVKPGNIIIDRRNIILNEKGITVNEGAIEFIDFGTGCATSSQVIATNKNILNYTLGTTPDYRPPEFPVFDEKEAESTINGELPRVYLAVTSPSSQDDESSDNEDNDPSNNGKRSAEKRNVFDIYSLGLVFAQMITLKDIDFFTRLIEGRDFKTKIPEFREKTGPEERAIPGCEKKYADAIWQIIENMTDENPNERHSIDKVLGKISTIQSQPSKTENTAQPESSNVILPGMSSFASPHRKSLDTADANYKPQIAAAPAATSELSGDKKQTQNSTSSASSTSPTLGKSSNSALFHAKSAKSKTEEALVPLQQGLPLNTTDADAKADESHAANCKYQIIAAMLALLAIYIIIAIAAIFCPPSSLLSCMLLLSTFEKAAVIAGFVAGSALVATTAACATTYDLNSKSAASDLTTAHEQPTALTA